MYNRTVHGADKHRYPRFFSNSKNANTRFGCPLFFTYWDATCQRHPNHSYPTPNGLPPPDPAKLMKSKQFVTCNRIHQLGCHGILDRKTSTVARPLQVRLTPLRGICGLPSGVSSELLRWSRRRRMTAYSFFRTDEHVPYCEIAGPLLELGRTCTV